MLDLKPYYDSAQTADAEVKRILGEMDAAFHAENQAEGETQALALRPALDAARAKAEAANQLYISMRDASSASGSVARNFVPVPGAETNQAPKKLQRAEFQALNSTERMAFIKAGGVVTDEVNNG